MVRISGVQSVSISWGTVPTKLTKLKLANDNKDQKTIKEAK